jgi:flagellar secretion chaperone FliS
MMLSYNLQTYRELQLRTADPGTVLLMLYQGAIDALNQAIMHLSARDFAQKGACLLRAHDIITQFVVSLDHKTGGEITQNLERLYGYMLDQILLGNVNNDPKALETVASLLSTLKTGWEEAVVVQRKKAAAGGA